MNQTLIDNDPVFRLTRLILIDSYCANKIAEVDVSGHITINGENGAGKTMLLRLFPLFFGESPSKVIFGDKKFGRHYFPSQASYIVFEYQRRNQKALAVIHAEGSGDTVAYRFIDSEYRTELFKDGEMVVQSGALHRHLDKLGVFDSKPLPLYAYRQIIQNTAGREHKFLSGRFSFTSGTGKLTHIEKVVTGILQRATTFHDLKRMIVSSILDGDEGFALQTGKKDLLHWVSEYEAHHALMEKIPVMSGLEQSDSYRKATEFEFSRLHAKFKLLLGYFDQQVIWGEKTKAAAKEDKAQTEQSYDNRLRDLLDKKNDATSKAKVEKDFIDQLDLRKRLYEQEEADGKVLKVNALPGLLDELSPLEKQLDDLEKEVKSLTEVFADMENGARIHAGEEKAKQDAERGNVFQESSKRKDDLAELYRENMQSMRNRHEPELDRLSVAVSELRVEESALAVEVRNAQPDIAIQEALAMDRQAQSDSSAKLDKLRDESDGLRRGFQKAKEAFEEMERHISGGEIAVEKIQEELEILLAADSASEDTLLGCLRRNKADWAENIGRLVSDATLLRKDLAPTFGIGDSLYGVSIDLSRLKAGRFASEENLQQEIKLAKQRLENRVNEIEEYKNALVKKSVELEKAKKSVGDHDATMAVARNAKLAADQRVQSSERRLADSKRAAIAKAEDKLKVCRQQLSLATGAVEAAKKAHREELACAESSHKEDIARLKAHETTRLGEIETRKRQIDADLSAKLATIAKDRDDCLRNKGVSTETMNGIRLRIAELKKKIQEGKELRGYVDQYLVWLQNSWTQRAAKQREWQEFDAKEKTYKRNIDALIKERDDVLEEKKKAIVAADKLVEKNSGNQRNASFHVRDLANWPEDSETLAAGFDHNYTIEALMSERKRLQGELEGHREKIRTGAEEILRQMGAVVGTGPEKFLSNALRDRDRPRPGREHEWIEIFRNWFGNEQATHRTSLLQIGKTRAQTISHFWKSLGDFRQNVSSFATDLASNLEQGKIFDSIADVKIDIRAHIDTQNYWESVETLHHEYDAWHAQGDASLPPPGFVTAIKKVAEVLSDERGLVADPVDLIALKISANVNGQGSRTASNEKELANMSSNGLSYIILCVILIGFVSRIRRKEQVVVPFVVDELRDLSFHNTQTLMSLLTRNNITMVSAFPDIDLDLAELFTRNYKIQSGRKIALIELESEDEVAYV